MDVSTAEQWAVIGKETMNNQGRVAERILGLLESLSEVTDGFAVDQLTHCLQTATRAEEAGANDEWVVASLCHDIGKAISVPNHPRIAAEMLRPYVDPAITAVIVAHQDFQGRHYYHHFGGNPDALYLCSRSSGSHLAGCVLITEWEKQGLPLDILKGAVMGSGMYDLKPVRLSKRSSFVTFTDEAEQQLSAIRYIERIHTPLVLVNGSLETPEFLRQSREFAAALKAAGKPVQYIVGPGYNHYEVGETIGNPYALLGRAAMDMMKLNTL